MFLVLWTWGRKLKCLYLYQFDQETLTLNFVVQIKYEPYICKKSLEKWMI